MKKTHCLLVGVFLVSALLAAAEIRVTNPNASSKWCIGTTYMITWTPSGDMPNRVTIRLRRAGSPSSEAAVQVISPGTSLVDPFRWTIPNTVRPGMYFIRIKTIGGMPGGTELTGDSANFEIKTCVQVIQAPTLTMQIDPRLLQRTFTKPVNFTTKTKSKHEYWWNCLARSGTGGEHVLPTELLVGFENHRVDRGSFCTDECVSLVYRGRPSFPDLMPLVGKELIKATLSFRHNRTEANPDCANCLYKIYFYSGRIGETNPAPYETRMLAVSISGTYEFDVIDIIRRWLNERNPTYHGDLHNYAIEFGGGNERFDCNNEKCLSWFDSGSLEVKYRD